MLSLNVSLYYKKKHTSVRLPQNYFSKFSYSWYIIWTDKHMCRTPMGHTEDQDAGPGGVRENRLDSDICENIEDSGSCRTL